MASLEEVLVDEQTASTIYEAPALVELGEFCEDTLGLFGHHFEGLDLFDYW